MESTKTMRNSRVLFQVSVTKQHNLALLEQRVQYLHVRIDTDDQIAMN